MKNRKWKKLSIRKDTLRALYTMELEQAHGGGTNFSQKTDVSNDCCSPGCDSVGCSVRQQDPP